MNTETPRTDKFTSTWDFHDEPFEAAEHARTLERELTAAQEELAEWSILKGWGGTPEIINDFIKGQQTRIHYAQNLEEELTAVTEQRETGAAESKCLTKGCGNHRHQGKFIGDLCAPCNSYITTGNVGPTESFLGDLQRERDEAIAEATNAVNDIIGMKWQRDRLAEAVNAATILIAAKGRHNTMLAYNGLRDALQSLP
jgi:hypothetical protein